MWSLLSGIPLAPPDRWWRLELLDFFMFAVSPVLPDDPCASYCEPAPAAECLMSNPLFRLSLIVFYDYP